MIDTRLHTIIGHLVPFTAWDGIAQLSDTPRWQMYLYVARCEQAGFCDTDSMRVECARRWLAGKRAITPPGAKRRKRARAERLKLMANIPAELVRAVESACSSEAVLLAQRNPKTVNALVGAVLKHYKFDAGIVRSLIEDRVSSK